MPAARCARRPTCSSSLVAANGDPLVVDGRRRGQHRHGGAAIARGAGAPASSRWAAAWNGRPCRRSCASAASAWGCLRRWACRRRARERAMSLDMDQFHEVFFEESFESIDAMEAALLRLTPGVRRQRDHQHHLPHRPTRSRAAPACSASARLPLSRIRWETLLDELRSGKLQVTTPMCDGLLQSVDVMRTMMTAQKGHQPLDLSISQVLQAQFKRMIAGEGQPGVAGAAPAAAASPAAPVAVAPAAVPTPLAPAVVAATIEGPPSGRSDSRRCRGLLARRQMTRCAYSMNWPASASSASRRIAPPCRRSRRSTRQTVASPGL